MKIEIQSVIDLITNSSTETFTILSDNAESLIKDVVNSIALDFIYEEIKKVAIDNGAMTYNEFCKQENDDSYDYMPALKTFYVNVKEGLDNEDAKLAACALNALEELYSADYRCG